MKKTGRKSAYDEIIKPNFPVISQMVSGGCTYSYIAQQIGVAVSTFMRYKSEKPEFSELLKKSRNTLVSEVKSALKRKAVGFEYTEVKRIHERGDDGAMELVRIEETLKTSPPDVAAANLLLKNYDRDNWSNDPQLLQLKKEEIALRREIAERDRW